MRLSAIFFSLVFLLPASVKAFVGGPAVTSQEDSSRVNLLNGMAMSLRETDHEAALQYAQDALKLAKKLNYERGQATALGHIGWTYYRKSDYVNALQNSIEALKISEQIGDEAEMARSLNNIAAVSSEQKQYKKALTELRRALQLSKKVEDDKVTGRTLNNMAYIFLMTETALDSAEHYARLALDYSEKIRDSYLVAFSLRSLGDVLANKKKYEEALTVYQRSMLISESSRNRSLQAATNFRIAKVYRSQDKWKEAIAVLDENTVLAREKGYLEELERTFKMLSEIYHEQGDRDNAYQFLQQYTVLHDSLYTQQRTRQISLLQNQFDLDIKQAQIELLTKDAALKQEEISGQRLQLYVTILAGSAGLLLVIVMLYSYQRVKRANQELRQQKEQLAKKNVEIVDKSEELSQMNSTKDKLLSIIGHDFRSPLQTLKGLLKLIGNKNMSQSEFEHYTKELIKKVDNVYDNLDNVLTWSVSQLKGIQVQPTRIDPLDLIKEVFSLYAEMALVKNVELVIEEHVHVHALADKDQIRLVIRNLVSNALKFTPSEGSVKAGVKIHMNTVMVFVTDSGVGITTDNLHRLFVRESLWSAMGTNNEKGLGLGLLLCKEFVEMNNGTLDIKSEQGQGSTISFALPPHDIRELKEVYSEGPLTSR